MESNSILIKKENQHSELILFFFNFENFKFFWQPWANNNRTTPYKDIKNFKISKFDLRYLIYTKILIEYSIFPKKQAAIQSSPFN